MRKSVVGVGAAVVVLLGAALFVALPAVSDDDDGGSASNNLNALSASRGSTGRSVLEIDGGGTAQLRSVSGGAIFADVIEEAAGTGVLPNKHLGQVQYEPFTVAFGTGTSRGVWNWVSQAIAGIPQQKNATIAALDFDFKVQGQKSLTDTVITGVGVPGCDAAEGKTPLEFMVQLTPSQTTDQKGSGAVKGGGVAGKGTQPATINNCKVTFPSLDGVGVVKVAPFGIEMRSAGGSVGTDRIREPGPNGAVEYPNLRIEVSKAKSVTWEDWHKTFLIDGKNGQNAEKSGSLVYLSPNLQSELMRVDFTNCGIFSLQDAPTTAGTDQTSRVSVDLYCEKMALSVSPTFAP